MVQTHRDNDRFSNKPFRVPRSSFRKAIWKTNAWYLLCLELTFVHEALVLIPKDIRYRFFSGIFPSKMKFNHSVLGSDRGRLWRLLCSLVHPKTQHKASLMLLYIMPVMADRIFSLRAVFMLWARERHKWAGLFPLSDVHRGRIWNSSFWKTVYDLLVL